MADRANRKPVIRHPMLSKVYKNFQAIEINIENCYDLFEKINKTLGPQTHAGPNTALQLELAKSLLTHFTGKEWFELVCTVKVQVFGLGVNTPPIIMTMGQHENLYAVKLRVVRTIRARKVFNAMKSVGEQIERYGLFLDEAHEIGDTTLEHLLHALPKAGATKNNGSSFHSYKVVPKPPKVSTVVLHFGHTLNPEFQ